MDQWSQTKVARVGRSLLMAAAALALANGCASDEPAGTPAGAPPTVGVPTAGAPGVVTPPPTTTNPVNGGVMPGVPNNATGSGGAAMPCAVETVVKTGCQTCHGATPIGGAPMKLTALADFQRDYTAVTTTQLKGKAMKMHELARIRMNTEMGTTIMPQGAPLATADFAALDGWLRQGAPGGTACATAPGGDINNPPTGNAGAAGSVMAGAGGATAPPPVSGRGSECEVASAFEPLVAMDGETCYEFKTHGVSGATDTTEFRIPVDESYSQFYFNVPWPAGSISTRYGAKFDNLAVLHHWLAFSSSSPNAHGTVSPNVTGTTIGEGTELIAGWAVGGCNTVYPPDVGVKLPSSGKIMVQWHHYNNTGMTQTDGSAVQICTVPAGGRPNVAGLTFLGTENFNSIFGMGPGKQEFTTGCLNDSGADITIIGFDPHMHTIGSNMKSVILRANGMKETIFDKPFKFDQQVNYMLKPPVVLKAGETIESTCTFQNDTGANVAFGQSTNQEMCYQFALAYPYGALNNGAPSLIGASNTCW
jgi:hypothetical protein